MDSDDGEAARPAGAAHRGGDSKKKQALTLPSPASGRGEKPKQAPTLPLQCSAVPRTAGAVQPASGRGELGRELSDYQAGANRRIQVTKRGWNRFDAAKKKIFLKWFAATANAAESARRAGVAKSTVFDHRMKDGRFAEAWDRALEQGYARLEAKALEMQFDQAKGEPIDFDGSFEPPDAPLVDLTMALQLLKQHKAEVTQARAERGANPRARGRRKQLPPNDRPRLASDAEVRRALVKSLRAFGVRVTKEDLKHDDGSK